MKPGAERDDRAVINLTTARALGFIVPPTLRTVATRGGAPTENSES